MLVDEAKAAPQTPTKGIKIKFKIILNTIVKPKFLVFIFCLLAALSKLDKAKFINKKPSETIKICKGKMLELNSGL